MQLRFAGLACVLLLAGCSGYAPGRSAADFPTEVKTIKLERLAALAPANRRSAPNNAAAVQAASDEFGRSADPSPDVGTREVLDVFKTAMVEEFQHQGIRVLDDDAATPDLKIRVMVDYTPEFGYLVHRSIVVDMYIASRDDMVLRREHYSDANILFGAISSIVQSRDDMTRVAARNVVNQAVTELRKRLRTSGHEALPIALRYGPDAG